MTEKISSSSATSNEKTYTFEKNPLPLDMLSEGPAGEVWYRIPTWRVTFQADALAGLDLRVHRGLGHEGIWTLTEASTGCKLYDGWDDEPEDTADDMLAEFVAVYLPKLTREMMEKSVAGAKEKLKGHAPSPFARSETRAIEPEPVPLFGQPEALLAFLEQAGAGAISGHINDWPQFRLACRWAAEQIKASRSATAANEAKIHQQFADCVRNLVNGSAFDLTDSPKSFIATVQRLVSEMNAELPEYVPPRTKVCGTCHGMASDLGCPECGKPDGDIDGVSK